MFNIIRVRAEFRFSLAERDIFANSTPPQEGLDHFTVSITEERT